MKKIVLVNGSPRTQGSCAYLCSEFAHAASDHEITRLNLADRNYGYYSDPLPDDDFEAAANLLEAADIIVLATPLFFYNMSGQMKVFMDRLLPYFSRLKDKKFYFILTAATPQDTMEPAIDSMTAFTDSLPGAKVEKVFCAANLRHRAEVASHPVVQEIIDEAHMIGNR